MLRRALQLFVGQAPLHYIRQRIRTHANLWKSMSTYPLDEEGLPCLPSEEHFEIADVASAFTLLNREHIPSCYSGSVALNFYKVPLVAWHLDVSVPTAHLSRAKEIFTTSKRFIALKPGDVTFTGPTVDVCQFGEPVLANYPRLQVTGRATYIRLIPGDTVYDFKLPDDYALMPVHDTGLAVPVPRLVPLVHGLFHANPVGIEYAVANIVALIDYGDLEEDLALELDEAEGERFRELVRGRARRMRGKREQRDAAMGPGAWKGFSVNLTRYEYVCVMEL